MRGSKKQMSFLACGVNYKTATLALREKLAITPEKLPDSLNDLMQQTGIAEAAILSTCNRTEIYCAANDDIVLLDWLSRFHRIPTKDLQPHYYQHYDQNAFKHVLRVASGLDSMVLGEPQILGQMKTAVTQAEQIGTVGSTLRELFSAIFFASKKIRTETELGVNPQTIASVSYSLAKRIFADISRCQILCVGAGETVELVAQHFMTQQKSKIAVANRTLNNAKKLAEKFHGQGYALSDIPHLLADADIVIAATSSSLPILGKGLVERVLKLRKHKPILMFDLGVPRDIEIEIGHLNDIYLYSLDDIQQYIQENKGKRLQAAVKAESFIDQQADHFERERQVRSASAIVREYREKMLKLSEVELTKAEQRIAAGEDPVIVMQHYAHILTRKFLHNPSIQIRQAAYNGQADFLMAAQQLLNLDISE